MRKRPKPNLRRYPRSRHVEGAARNANNQFARLADRLDHIERAQADPNAKVARIAEAVDRLEKERKSVMAAAGCRGP
jgi:hypothetical protein